MFLNFQTQEDIRREILISLKEIGRPATIDEVAAAIWFRSAVDGTRHSVTATVRNEMGRMLQDGHLEAARDYRPGTRCDYYRPDLLTRMSFIRD